MDKTTTWLVRGAALIVIGGGLFAFLGSGNKIPIKIKSTVPTVEDWKYKELKIRYDAAKDTAAQELMMYKKLGQKIFCNASLLSEIEAIGYSKKMDLYIKGKDADTSKWDSLINQFESVRSECRDFNP